MLSRSKTQTSRHRRRDKRSRVPKPLTAEVRSTQLPTTRVELPYGTGALESQIGDDATSFGLEHAIAAILFFAEERATSETYRPPLSPRREYFSQEDCRLDGERRTNRTDDYPHRNDLISIAVSAFLFHYYIYHDQCQWYKNDSNFGVLPSQ